MTNGTTTTNALPYSLSLSHNLTQVQVKVTASAGRNAGDASISYSEIYTVGS